MTKGPPRHKETWWWNRDVEKVVAKQKVCHKAWRKSKSAEDKHTLDVAKKEVYTAVMTAQESKLQEFTADLQTETFKTVTTGEEYRCYECRAIFSA